MFEVFGEMTHQYTRTSYEQLKDFIYRFQEKLFDLADEERAGIQTREELAAYNLRMRAEFIRRLGGLPKAESPLNPRIVRSYDAGDFTVEAVIFQSRPGVFVTGNFYKPKNIKEPAPCVLFVCGHAEEGRLDEDYQVVCQTIVRAGLCLFAIDPMGQGERADFYDPLEKRFLIKRTTQDHDAVGVPAVATGKFLQRYFLNDEMRAVDYLLSRDDVDPKRIGLTGNSGGGTQTLATVAVDDRIAAAAPGNFVTTRRRYMYTGQAQDSEQLWPGMTEYGFDHVNPLMLFAPKPFAILATKYDFFPIEGTLETFETAKRFYKMLGSEDALRLYFDAYTHKYTLKLARDAAAFFSEVFLGEAHTVDNTGFKPLPFEVLQCTESGQVKDSLPEYRFPYEEIAAEAEALRKSRLSLPPEERLARAKAWLSEKVYHARTPYPFYPRIFPKPACVQVGGFMGVSCSWWTQKELFAYGVIIKPEVDEDIEALPVTFCIWTDGTKEIGTHEAFIREEIAKGRQVFVLDVPGNGAIEQRNMVINCPYKKAYGTLYTLATQLMYAGDSLTAMRVYDVLRAIRFLVEEFGVAEKDIRLYCEGDEGVYGIMAAFLNEKVDVVYGRDLMLSVEERMIRTYPFIYNNSLLLEIPGMLEYFDYAELLR